MLRDLVFVIAQKRHLDIFFLRPRFLRERIVAADSVNRRVQSRVGGQVDADAAHFRRARAGKRHREKASRVFRLPKFSLNLICFGPSAVLVGRVKSGALVPTASGITEFQYKIDISPVKKD